MSIIGPIDSASWITLKQLKRSIDFMKKEDSNKYKTAIKRETDIYDYMLDQFKEAA